MTEQRKRAGRTRSGDSHAVHEACTLPGRRDPPDRCPWDRPTTRLDLRRWRRSRCQAPGRVPRKSDVLYICPMMCTPPVSEPGRCPVCGMELVPSSTGDGRRRRAFHSNRSRLSTRCQYPHGCGEVGCGITRDSSHRPAELRRRQAQDPGGLRRRKTRSPLRRLHGRGCQRRAMSWPCSTRRNSTRHKPNCWPPSERPSPVRPPCTPARSIHEVWWKALARNSSTLGMTEAASCRLEETRQPVTRIELVAPIHGTVIDQTGVGRGVREDRPADLSPCRPI
jgi:hypothetical protein